MSIRIGNKEKLLQQAEMSSKKILMGSLNNYLRETLDLILKKIKITAKDLSETMKLEANTSGTRLLNLHKKRLVKRTEEIRDGGRVWVYVSCL